MLPLLCVILVVGVHSSWAALWMEDVYTLARRCIKLPEVNGTENDVNDLLMGYLPDTKSGMCMLRCMETHAGILVNDTYDVRGAYLFFRAHFPENPYHKNMERGVRFCQKVVQKRITPTMDRCQFAHMVAACIRRRIKFVPGCRAAYYKPFVWKNPFKKGTVRPGKKYFVVKRQYIPRHRFEVLTRPTRKYTLEDAQKILSSGDMSEEHKDAAVWLPPRPRKGKRMRDPLTDKRKEFRKGKKKKPKPKSSDSEDDSSWDKSVKTRRHIDKEWI